MTGQTGAGVAERRWTAAFAIRKADIRISDGRMLTVTTTATFGNNEQSCRGGHVACWSFSLRCWDTSLFMMISVSSGINSYRPARGNVTLRHFNALFSPSSSFSIRISSARAPLSVFILTSLLMLFQVFCLYLITTKINTSPETSPSTMLCLLAVFIAYSAHSALLLLLSPSPFLPCDVFQAVPEKPQWDCGQTEQSGHPWSRLQYQGHGQWQLHVQMCPHADWWWVQPNTPTAIRSDICCPTTDFPTLSSNLQVCSKSGFS